MQNGVMTSSAPRSSSAKRSASGNISNTSDDEQDELRELAPSSSSNTSSSRDWETCSSADYDNPCSPGASSTSSGPVYIRPPGFRFHAQEITRPRIKKKKSVPVREGLKKREPTPPKHKLKRDPLPMRMRSLPQSFWQQPNTPDSHSPANMFRVLPPLSTKDDDMDNVRPVTPPSMDQTKCAVDTSGKDKPLKVKSDRNVIVTGNPESQLSRLFEKVEEKMVKKSTTEASPPAGLKVPVPPSTSVKKGSRQKKIISSNKTMYHGNDPYMVDTVTDSLFPHLSLEKGGGKTQHTNGSSSIQLITLKQGDKTVTLPSLCIEQNYSQMLSELVPHL